MMSTFHFPWTARWVIGLVWIALATFGSPVRGQGQLGTAEEEAFYARGFEPDKVFDVGDIDAINPFSGQLSLTIPIGRSYPINGGFSFSFALTYTSQVWDFQHVASTNPQRRGNQASPSQIFNAGLGWQLSQGRLFEPLDHPPGVANQPPPLHDEDRWVYVSPDGSRHYFYGTYDGGPDPDDQPNVLPKYTRDGSYLRLVSRNGQRCVEAPNGVDRCFANLRGVGEDSREWRLASIRDAFGSGVDAVRSGPPSGPAAPNQYTWTFTDDHGRVYEAEYHFRTNVGVYALHQVRLPGVGGTTAAYDFTYRPTDPTIERGCDNFFEPSTDVTVALLEKIDFPDGSFHAFDYPTGIVGCDEPSASGDRGRDLAGILRQARLRSGGSIRWTYDIVQHPSSLVCSGPNPVDPGEPNIPQLSESRGVAERVYLAQDGTNEVGRWSYHYALAPTWPSPGMVCRNRPREFVSTMVDPLGHRRVRYHSAYIFDPDLEASPGQNTEGWARGEYGLPFTRRVQEEGVYLSQLLYSCMGQDAELDRGPTPLPSSSCSVTQKELVRYEQDPALEASCDAAGNAAHPQCGDRNRRVVKRVSGHARGSAPDGFELTWQTHTGWDGLGHFQDTVSDGNFGPTGERVHHTTYAPASGPWLLDLWAHRWTEESGRREWEVATFDPNNGFLTSQRRLRSTKNQSTTPPLESTDVLACYTSEVVAGQPTGNVERERWLGGDATPLAGTDPCAGSTVGYQIERSFASGVLHTSEWVNPSRTSERLLRAEATSIDANTGLPLGSRDAADVVTTYQYAPWGWLRTIIPTSTAATKIDLFPAVNGNLARVETQRVDSGTVLAEDEVRYDAFGRIYIERRSMPGNAWAERVNQYHGNGWLGSQSDWYVPAIGSRGTTDHFQYDALGRASRIEALNGQNEHFQHFGARSSTRRAKVMTETGLVDDFMQHDYDRHGRLYLAHDLSDPDAPANPSTPGTPLSTRTYYHYDVADRLVGVEHERRDGSDQDRAFVYDGRGFLLWEKHPEFGVAGNGSVTQGDFDAFGRPGYRQWGQAGSGIRLDFDYDFAGRLVRVTDTAGLPLQAYFYARANQGADHRAGKLVQSKRHNRVDGVDRVVTESYFYERADGRLSRKSVRASAPDDGALRFETEWQYDALGNPSAFVYPLCEGTERCPGVSPRVVEHTYERGLLTGVAEPAGTVYVEAMTHDPNGLVTSIEHGNDVTEYQVPDPFGIPRATSIRVQRDNNGSVLFNTGPYAYDARGNIHTIGGDQFSYDRASRLTRASQSGGGGATVQTYGYDRFGNLDAITTDGEQRGLEIDPASNRLLRMCVTDQPGATCAQPPQNPGPPTFTYDVLGNVDHDGRFDYRFDAAGQLTAMQGLGVNRRYLYDADGERVAVFNDLASRETWTLRGLADQVFSEIDGPAGATGAAWSQKDYIRTNSRLIASVEGTDRRHFHLDHLGSTRMVTEPDGSVLAQHKYRPYGEELGNPNNDDDRMRFAGHERDFHCPAGQSCTGSQAGDLDYMHARYYNPWPGRFLSVDAVLGSVGEPKSWNRYAYVLGNPLGWVDPDGNDERTPALAEAAKKGVKYKVKHAALDAVEHRYGRSLITRVPLRASPYLLTYDLTMLADGEIDAWKERSTEAMEQSLSLSAEDRKLFLDEIDALRADASADAKRAVNSEIFNRDMLRNEAFPSLEDKRELARGILEARQKQREARARKKILDDLRRRMSQAPTSGDS